MGLGAIVVIGGEPGALGSAVTKETGASFTEPLPYLDILGRSTVERIIERFVRAETEVVSLLVQDDKAHCVAPSPRAFENADVQFVIDSCAAIRDKLQEYSQNGVEHTFVVSGSVYAETDLLDLFYFHREARQAATRALDRQGPLDLWVVDCKKAQQSALSNFLTQPAISGNSYFIREYVKRLTHPEDLRQFVSDVLRGRCAARPPGQEIKRGIWIDDGAEVNRRARIVAPAYIGRASKVMEDTLITRCSSVEKDCCIDYGTIVENSSILQNTHVGICLDVCHGIANGNKFMSLSRNVVIEISDPAVMRSNSMLPKQAKVRKRATSGLLFRRRKKEHQIVNELQPAAAPAPDQCGLAPNPIQGG
ncbi:MAG: hypothetical protein WB660_21560 [Candidatus Sulfotelmatobacter sp.]